MIAKKLRKRAQDGNPIRVGWVGAGRMTNEIPLSIVWAVEDGEPTVAPSKGLVSEVVGSAKSDLKSGTLLDGGGGYCVFGVIDLATRAKAENAVPFGLLNGAKLLHDVKRDQVITYDAVELCRIPCSTP